MGRLYVLTLGICFCRCCSCSFWARCFRTQLDWLILIGTLAVIVSVGLWKGRSVRTAEQYLRAVATWQCGTHRPVDRGGAGECDHVSVDARPNPMKTDWVLYGFTLVCRWRW